MDFDEEVFWAKRWDWDCSDGGGVIGGSEGFHFFGDVYGSHFVRIFVVFWGFRLLCCL